ncbi:MAG: bifunctional 4-hydroxy-2-oxoglutarate aldolase/2-dehydro-3-deoxy-phosphogluconate aldolase [Bacilli bacterium]|nr:bifunctional 4-hydroxy-2-oxoglutarate aldolase/2-dehydro-3-deoxy-phosphogluconate aldolase [Bacilli bacterium]
MNALERIKLKKLLPVVVFKSIEEAEPTFDAMVAGGMDMAEICFRTPCARDAIELLAKKYPEALIGAGTVINAEQCNAAIDAGAKFIVSPGLSANVARVCKERGILYLPGVATATEVMAALDLGLTTLKFFPATNLGGVKSIKALGAAFPHVSWMPTGGVNQDNILDFLAYDHIICCGGSFMMQGTSEEITSKTRDALALIGGK